MFLQQLSVFVENRTGSISDVTAVLAEHNINIRALSIADTTDFGIIRLIVDNTELAADKLRENSIIVNISNVIGIKIPDTPGSFHNFLSLLSDADIAIEYSYAFLSGPAGHAYIIIRVQNEDDALRILSLNGASFLSSAD